jgi:hypothetical protein
MRVPKLGSKGSGFRISTFGLRVYDKGSVVQDLGFMFKIRVLGFRVQGSGSGFGA